VHQYQEQRNRRVLAAVVLQSPSDNRRVVAAFVLQSPPHNRRVVAAFVLQSPPQPAEGGGESRKREGMGEEAAAAGGRGGEDEGHEGARKTRQLTVCGVRFAQLQSRLPTRMRISFKAARTVRAYMQQAAIGTGQGANQRGAGQSARVR